MCEENKCKEKKEKLIFFNEALDYFQYNTPDDTLISNAYEMTKNCEILREQMLQEIGVLSEILEDYTDVQLDFLSEAEKEEFYKFIRFYSQCPICNTFNHTYILRDLYFNEKNKEFKSLLTIFMKIKEDNPHKKGVNFGVPCCNCYKRFLEK